MCPSVKIYLNIPSFQQTNGDCGGGSVGGWNVGGLIDAVIIIINLTTNLSKYNSAFCMHM
jgi:hypothetical protein